MNMLTEYMGNTLLEQIVGNMDAIWKFNRAQVGSNFIREIKSAFKSLNPYVI